MVRAPKGLPPVLQPLPRSLHLPFLALVGGLLLAAPYLWAEREAHIAVDGQLWPFRSYQRQVGRLLEEAGVKLYPEDRVYPGPEARVQARASIRVERAQSVALFADGRVRYLRSNATSLEAALQEWEVPLLGPDLLWRDGTPVAPGDTLVSPRSDSNGFDGIGLLANGQGEPVSAVSLVSAAPTRAEVRPPQPSRSRPLLVQIQRALPIHLEVNGVGATVYSQRGTVAELLLSQGIALGAADGMTPDPHTPLTAGLRVSLERAKPVFLRVERRLREVHTRAKTVAELLHREGISINPQDRVEPGLESPVLTGMRVTITRIKEESFTEEQVMRRPLQYVADANLEIDEQRVLEGGSEGLRKQKVHVRYEDGFVAERTVLEEWVEVPPTTRVLAFGTKIVERTLDTPDGPITYWRRTPFWATSYNASHGWLPPGHPRYGYTRLGLFLEKGIVAIDPTVVPFLTRLYIPGYGFGLAADTGGAVKGKIIDLGFPEDVTGAWSARWTDIYWLSPAPPVDEIRWMLPDYPTPPR